MASELSELRAELWRTRDDLERMKSRTPPSVDRSSRRVYADGRKADCVRDHHAWREQDGIKGAKIDGGGGGVRSGATSPPTSGASSGSERYNGINGGSRGRRVGRYLSGTGVGAEEEAAAAEETLGNLELEGAAFKNWTEEASSIAIRLIEEVKTLRWEKSSWAERDAMTEHAAEELRARVEALEKHLHSAETDGKRSKDALLRAQEAEREQLRAAERAKADLRAAQEKTAELRAQMVGMGGDVGVGVGGGVGIGGLREQLRREKEGADALQRRLDVVREEAARYESERKEWHASKARHERERKAWRVSRARLEELRRSWGKQLKKVIRVLETTAV